MSKDIIGFYQGVVRNQEGYSINDILKFSDEKLEDNHCYIQWIFPLPERSKAVPGSPFLRQADINEFNDSGVLQSKMIELFYRVAGFYGLGVQIDPETEAMTIKVMPSDGLFEKKTANWLTPHNHNFLRISRIIRSLKLAGLEQWAQGFYKCMCEIYENNKTTIGPVTKQFWDKAIEKDF